MAIDPSRDHPRGRRRPIGSRATARGVRRRSKFRSPERTGVRRDGAEVSSLELLVGRLRTIFGTAITAELALRKQGAERDVEIADCLRGGVSEPLADQIERLGLLAEDEPRVTKGSGFRGRALRRTRARRARLTSKGRSLH